MVLSFSDVFIPTNQFLLLSYFPKNNSQELWLFFHLSISHNDTSHLSHHIYSFMLSFTNVGSCLLSMLFIYCECICLSSFALANMLSHISCTWCNLPWLDMTKGGPSEDKNGKLLDPVV